MKKFILLALCMLANLLVNAQDITFTFQNARNTNDGINDYYEADIYIASNQDFKAGSGQIYFTYNPDAFGVWVHTNGNFVMTQPDGSILGSTYSGFPAHKDFIVNDNTSFRVSTSFQQGLSSGTITANNVTSTPNHLFSVKFKYIDVSENPNIAFETGSVYLDQFFTACGPNSFGFPNCTEYPGVQLKNDTFDSSGAEITTTTLGTNTIELSKVSILPNPVKGKITINGLEDKIAEIEIYNTNGVKIKSVENDVKTIDVSNLLNGVYIVKISTPEASKTIKFIKE